MFTYQTKSSDLLGFIQFWSAAYQYENNHLYDENIGQPLTEVSLRALYLWKNGGELSKAKRLSVEHHFVDRLPDLQKLPDKVSAEEFLNTFQDGGTIWRIFYLHCWKPNEFPIYDQHVHRAMSYLRTGTATEIPRGNSEKVRTYLTQYLGFHSGFDFGDQRVLDKALWAFGRYLKSPMFPLL